MAGYRSELKTALSPFSDCVWMLCEPLIYESDVLGTVVTVPAGFFTDLASVPRVPVIFTIWGNRSHREAVVHDYLYCTNSVPVVSKLQADRVFLEAMKAVNKSCYIRWFMFIGVAGFSWMFYHRRKVEDKL